MTPEVFLHRHFPEMATELRGDRDGLRVLALAERTSHQDYIAQETSGKISHNASHHRYKSINHTHWCICSKSQQEPSFSAHQLCHDSLREVN